MTDKFIYIKNYRGLEMIEEEKISSIGGRHKVGNVNVQIGSEKGYYVGSATNMTRQDTTMCHAVLNAQAVICQDKY